VKRPGLVIGLAVAVAIGMAACGPAIPSTPRSDDAAASPSALAGTVGSSTPSPSLAADPGQLSGLGRALDVLHVDGDFSSRVLEFASTGSAIVASAGDGIGETAPDLYSILPRTGEPTLLWRNPDRDHSIVKMAGDVRTVAFVDLAVDGTAEWTLWLIPDDGEEPLVLDKLPDDPDVPTLVPSVSVYWPYVAWTAFDSGPDGPVSQLLVAEAPDWEPRVLVERPAAEAELWFPHVYGSSLLYTQLVYADDGQSDERSVWRTDVQGSSAERLDTTGRAVMPVMNLFGLLWKESEPGMHMLNWGMVEAYDADAGTSMPVSDASTNFPSAGERYATWWLVDTSRLEVWDAQAARTVEITRYDRADQRVMRPHVMGSLIAWLYVDERVEPPMSEIRYAFLP
jgi:hypothetical protein